MRLQCDRGQLRLTLGLIDSGRTSLAALIVFTVALIGPDGSGKTTISRRLETELGLPVTSLYMGVNMYSSSVMLPHMRLIRYLRQRRRTDDPRLRSDIKDDKEQPKTAAPRPLGAIRS